MKSVLKKPLPLLLLCLGLLFFLFACTRVFAEEGDTSSTRLYAANHWAYVDLSGDEGAGVRSELQHFLDTNQYTVQTVQENQAKAHVGYRPSNDRLYEIHAPTRFSFRSMMFLALQSTITIRKVREFNVNWHIRMPNTGMETWGAVYDEMATPDGRPLFCVEPWRLVNGFGGYTSTTVPGTITTRMKQGATLGYNKTKDIAHYWNTQTFLWQELGAQFLVNSLYNQGIQNEINQAIANVNKRPSFQNRSVTLKIGQSITLTDTNGVFRDYEKLASNTANVSISRNGNSLTLTARANSNESGIVSFDRYKTAPNSIAYAKGGSQTVAWLIDPIRNYFNISVKVLKNAPVVVEHRDRFTNELLKSSQDMRTIGSTYSYTPYNPLQAKGNTYVPVSTDAKTGTVKDGTNKVVFYYELQRTITIRHVDRRTNQLIVPETVDKKRQGQTYTVRPRTDLKKGSYAYRILTPDPVSGTVGRDNLTITFYYDLPLLDIGYKHIEILTANAKKGLPVTLQLDKTALYDWIRPEYAANQLTFQVTDQQTKHVVYSKTYALNQLPDTITGLLDPHQLKKNQHHTYQASILGLKDHEIVSHAPTIATDGYTASEKQFTVTASDTSVFSYKDVVKTSRDYGKDMVKNYEQFHLNVVKLAPQKTGYGFRYTLHPIYDNELSIDGHPTPRFHLGVDPRLIDSTLSYPIVNKQADLPLEITKETKKPTSDTSVQELPQVYVEKESGNCFSQAQKDSHDSRIHEELLSGGRNVYLPIWMDLGKYEVALHSDQPIGVHEIAITVQDQVAVEAYMFGHVKSPTIKKDELIVSPVRSDDPFPNGRFEGFTDDDLKWFQENGK